MSDISDLKQRVQAVGDRFGQLADQDRSYSARLTSLLSAVEEGITRSQEQNKQLAAELAKSKEDAARLTGDLTRAKEETEQLNSKLAGVQDENMQLRSMVQTLLTAVEEGSDTVINKAMRDLEDRIDRIVSSGSADLDTIPVGSLATAANASESPSVAQLDPAKPADEPEAPLELTAEMQVADDSDPSGSVEELMKDAAKAVSQEIKALQDEAESAAVAEAPAKADGALDTTEIPQDNAVPPSGAPSDDDLTAVNKIIQRISLLTGEFVDPAQHPPAEAGAAQSATAGDGSAAETATGNGGNNKKGP